MNAKKARIFFWIVTSLLFAGMIPSAVPSLLSLDYAVEHFTGHLGYPTYFLPFTGLAKLLGMIALVIPGYPRVKEWAYAGLVFDLIGAIYSGMAVGDGFSVWVFPAVDLVLLMLSYVFYRKMKQPVAPVYASALNK